MSAPIILHVHKAEPILKNQTTRDAQIFIDDPFPKLDSLDWERASREMHEQDAANIFIALSSTLPGGTMNRLHALMVKHYAGLFTIPQVTP